jgi:alkaline phosphatase
MTVRRDLLKHIGLGAITSLLASKAAAQPGKSSASKKIRGIVFLVSDGMSPGVLTLAQAFSKQIRKADTTWWQLLHRPDVVNGLMDTASANSLVTDSAAASSSWGSGQRVNNGMINVSPNGRSLEPIAWTLAERGIRTGLVSTASITHATPAGFAAQVKSRDDEQSIARQYLDRVDILLGGGLEFFQASTRNDKQDLPAAYRAAGYQVAFDAKTLASSNSQKILG